MAFHELWEERFELAPGKWVFVPSAESRERGERITSKIKEKWQAPAYFYHCHHGGHVRAIKQHLANTHFCCVDIESFFTSINLSRVTRALKQYFGYEVAREFARDSVIRLVGDVDSQYILPFGFVQSPIIASVCLDQSALGRVLHELASKPDITVSVYVDDIILSGSDPYRLQQEFESIKAAADRSGWKVSTSKTQPPGEQILSFNIHLSQGNLTISSERMGLFVDAYLQATSDHQKEGMLRYIRSINAAQATFFEVMDAHP
ncbi:reverse transcriptase domain-containing protein [Achromobacter sp. SIMBA_011]|uniref:reverse transcriptase domain-containing protein n=1 Tax=Achromobacter sp. SIMBA_011 TaxID=3085759 RepID=UPI003979F08B